MCSNASITEILGINDNNLVILGNKKENIKGIEYTVLRGKLSYRPACCPKCGIVNENYDIIRNGSQTVKILFNRVNTNPMILMVRYNGCIIFSVGERNNSLPTLNFLQKNRNTHQISCII